SVMRMEMKKDIGAINQAVVNNNGNFVEEEEEAVSSFKFSHLLASKDRDFLLSPSGAQVFFSPLSPFS
ncbi:nucleoredoxin, partial [Trifolium medium]|nr:nucleoredoxin [Trifolium medium]